MLPSLCAQCAGLNRLPSLSIRSPTFSFVQHAHFSRLSNSYKAAAAPAEQSVDTLPAPAELPTHKKEEIEPSSCVEGTVLTGINVLKRSFDPIAQADSAYPSWLWTLLDPKDMSIPKVKKAEERIQQIKKSNYLKKKKKS